MRTQYTNDIVLFTSAKRTAHANSADINTSGHKNIRFDIDITAATGTLGLVFTVQVWDRAKGGTGAYVDSALASASQTGAGHVVLNMGPDIATASNSGLNAVLPKKVRLKTSGTITTDVTYSVTATLV